MAEHLQKAQELHKAIRTILLNDWDPIGVRGLALDDEYDTYVVELYRLLIRRRPRHELVDYLNWAVSDNMGLPKNISRDESVADTLLSLLP